MSWFKVDNRFFTHPKVLELSNHAMLVHLAALGHCNEDLTDGYVSPTALRMLAARFDAPRDATAQELVAAGLWERAGTGYRVHDYLEYQPAAETVRQKRERAKDHMRAVRNGTHATGREQNVSANNALTADSQAAHVSANISLSSREVSPPDVDVDIDVEDRRRRAPATPSPVAREAAAAPAGLASFDTLLQAATGYAPTTAFFEQVQKYRIGGLDVDEEAVKMLAWLARADPAVQAVGCTPLFVLNWLKREVAHGTPRRDPTAARGGRSGGGGRARATAADFPAFAGLSIRSDDPRLAERAARPLAPSAARVG